jgi:hypothetical protein
MNRFILGMIAVATIAAGAPVSAAVQVLPGKAPPPLAGGGAYVGAYVGSHPTGDNFQYRQFACIRVGNRLVC